MSNPADFDIVEDDFGRPGLLTAGSYQMPSLDQQYRVKSFAPTTSTSQYTYAGSVLNA